MKMSALFLHAMTLLKPAESNVKEEFNFPINYQKIPTCYLEMTLIYILIIAYW